ncbi:MAG: hypothetical protein HYV35_03450, partial [Lentisphaerae bacterium]|nr:hypothetical protein [Lentisphaerota bacterium]
LIFSNWDSSLTATNVTILTNGQMTIPAAFSNNAMSNRVWIICSNLSIAAGASINADSKGYRGALNSLGETTGHGPGGSASSGGASYGGRGAGGANAGPIYGDASAPTEPGSGGGRESGSVNGGAGGGAIRIQASGAVTNNGTITANGGTAGGTYAGCGSGGGIYITCSTLSGTNGIIRASGGSQGNRGGAGGGRIAVIYDTNAQVSIPSLLFQTAGGAGNLSYGGYGGVGSLYFPNNLFLNPTNFIHAGQWTVPGFTSWAPGTLLVSNGWLRFPADGFQLTVTNDLSIVGTNSYEHRIELTNGAVTCGGNMFLTNAGLVLYAGVTSGPTLNCSGNLTLTNGAAIYVYNGPTNDGATNWSVLIAVTGAVFIQNNTDVYLYSDPTNGGSALMRMRNLTLGAGGTISADNAGFVGRSVQCAD